MLSLTASLNALDTPYLTFIFGRRPSAFGKRTVYLQSLLLVLFFIL